MSLALRTDSARPAFARSLAKLAQIALATLAFALVIAGVAFMRTFVFEYFHGDPAALHGLVRMLLGN